MAARFAAGGPTAYRRQQNSSEEGSLHPTTDNGQAKSPAILRRPTVRGAVRGTVRDAGASSAAAPNRMSSTPTRALTRGKTLNRPERFVTPAPLINPHTATGPSYSGADASAETGFDLWTLFVYLSTFWCPGFLLSAVGMPEGKQRAFREKCALCEIALFVSASDSSLLFASGVSWGADVFFFFIFFASSGNHWVPHPWPLQGPLPRRRFRRQGDLHRARDDVGLVRGPATQNRSRER